MFSVVIFSGPFVVAKGAENPAWCALPNGRILRVACTTDQCDTLVVGAVAQAAKKLGYKIAWSTVRLPTDLAKVDAFISPGGHDIDPKYYTQALSEAEKNRIQKLYRQYGNLGLNGEVETLPEYAKRDAREFAILNEYLNPAKNKRYQDLPFLGICYGMQALAAAHAVPLYVDIQAELGIANRRTTDDISFTPTHALTRYLPASNPNQLMQVDENHHQGVNVQYWKKNQNAIPQMRVTGFSNEGKIAELIELRNRPAIGVQFHAESSKAPAKLAPFLWLLENACRKANKAGLE